MKEKRILAMFITSAVTLVASLAVTFGVLMTLADPVVATGVNRYQFAFNYTNDSSISVDGNTLKLKEDIIFQPASSIVWDETEAIWFNGSTIEDEIVYGDESISTRLKVIPFKVVNKYTTAMNTTIRVTYDQTSTLGKFTYVKVFDYNHPENGFVDYTGEFRITLAADSTAEYAIVICADDSDNISVSDTINWGVDLLSVNVEVIDLEVRD